MVFGANYLPLKTTVNVEKFVVGFLFPRKRNFTKNFWLSFRANRNIQQIKPGGHDFWLCQKKDKDDLVAPSCASAHVFVEGGMLEDLDKTPYSFRTAKRQADAITGIQLLGTSWTQQEFWIHLLDILQF